MTDVREALKRMDSICGDTLLWADRFQAFRDDVKLLLSEYPTDDNETVTTDEKSVPTDKTNLLGEMLKELQSAVDMMDRAKRSILHRNGGNWGMLDTVGARAAIAKATQTEGTT